MSDSVIFSNPITRQVEVPIEEIVNGTIGLAQLLNAGQVKTLLSGLLIMYIIFLICTAFCFTSCAVLLVLALFSFFESVTCSSVRFNFILFHADV